MKDQQDIANHLSLNARPELLEVIANIADLKNIKEKFIFSMMEDVLTKMAATKYGGRFNVRARIYKNNGAIVIEKVVTVVENVEDIDNEISLVDAQAIKEDSKIGDEILEQLPPVDFTRSVMKKSLSILNKSIKDFEKSREYDIYKDSIGELISGVVKSNEFGNVILDIGNNSEGFLPRTQIINNEKINVGDRIRALIIEVKENSKGSQIILSRTNPNFIVKLFFQEIPEVFDGVVTIKAIARDPGSRTKVIVDSSNPAIDPVGVCVGFKGARIHGLLKEIKGEKIDLIKYSDQFLNLVINTFWPVEILKVILDEEKETLNIVINKSNLSMVIGRGGQNIRLISKLLKWNIEVLTEEEEKEKRQKQTQERVSMLMKALDVDEVVAHLLILEGFNNAESLSNANVETISKIEDFTEELSEELILRAKNYLAKEQQEIDKEIKKLNLSEDLVKFDNLNIKQKLTLGKANIKSLQDLADLSSFELAEFLAQENISMKKIESIVMEARDIVMESDVTNGRQK